MVFLTHPVSLTILVFTVALAAFFLRRHSPPQILGETSQAAP
jgi:hypothetical protein